MRTKLALVAIIATMPARTAPGSVWLTFLTAGNSHGGTRTPPRRYPDGCPVDDLTGSIST